MLQLLLYVLQISIHCFTLHREGLSALPAAADLTTASIVSSSFVQLSENSVY